jgi:GWxTD domain-containing protein
VRTLLATWALVTFGGASAQPQGLELRAVRFYRSAGSETLVDAFCRVSFALLDPLSPSPDGAAAYRVTLTVRDSAGLAVQAQSWVRSVPARVLHLAGGSSVEHFSFALRPGRYTVDVSVTDSATGRTSRQRGNADGFPGPPRASDLLLATGLREAAPTDTARPGEIRKGTLLLLASGRPMLTPLHARLGYYLELYPAHPETAGVMVRVKTPRGDQLVATEARRIVLDSGGGATSGVVDLTGLPPGDYRLEVAVAARDTTVRDADFGMAGLDADRARDALAALTEAQLDTLYLPLVYLMAAEEQGVYPGLTIDGKRAFLRQFWAKRDPTPGTARNEAQEDVYARIAEANRRFREGGATAIPGWRTDRGRIFIKYGRPDEVLERPQAGGTNPYIVWKYTQLQVQKYVFLDLTLFGNYVLIWTNDRREPVRPNWRELLGPAAVTDVMRF